MPFEYLDDIATADVAFRAWGETLEELFIAASDALMNVMVDNLEDIDIVQERELFLEAESLEMLLFALLQEIIFYKDAEQLLLRVTGVKVHDDGERFELAAGVAGESIDASRHELVVDVKAVTFHRYRVEETPQGWEAMVILDI